MKSPAASPARRSRLFGVALGCALVSSVALAAWAATDDVPPPRHGLGMVSMLPRGPLLDHLLDDVKASSTQRAQAHQIFDATDAGLQRDRAAERADRDQMTRLFAQPVVDAAAVEAVRERQEARHDAQSRRVTQALIDVSQVLAPEQRLQIARRLAAGPHPVGDLSTPHAAAAAND